MLGTVMLLTILTASGASDSMAASGWSISGAGSEQLPEPSLLRIAESGIEEELDWAFTAHSDSNYFKYAAGTTVVHNVYMDEANFRYSVPRAETTTAVQ